MVFPSNVPGYALCGVHDRFRGDCRGCTRSCSDLGRVRALWRIQAKAGSATVSSLEACTLEGHLGCLSTIFVLEMLYFPLFVSIEPLCAREISFSMFTPSTQDADGRQRRVLQQILELACQFATTLADHRMSDVDGCTSLPSPSTLCAAESDVTMLAGVTRVVAAAHEAACELFGVLCKLDSVMARPHFSLIFRLLAMGASRAPPSTVATSACVSREGERGAGSLDGGVCAMELQLILLAMCTAERQLPMLIQHIAAQVAYPSSFNPRIQSPPDSFSHDSGSPPLQSCCSDRGLGAIMHSDLFWRKLSECVSQVPDAQVCTPITIAHVRACITPRQPALICRPLICAMLLLGPSRAR